MQPLTAVVLGATGLTGEHIVQLLLDDPAFSKVRILVRKQVKMRHPKLEIEVLNFDNLADFRKAVGNGDYIFCCIGTTLSQVKGDRNAYRKIDFDIAVNTAKMGRDAGFSKYLLISAVRANVASRNFYLHLKGEVEEAIAGLSYPSFHVFRPGILHGKRKSFRLVETFSKKVVDVIGFMFTGAWSKYKSIAGADLAKAMVAASKIETKRMIVYHWEDMKRLIRS